MLSPSLLDLLRAWWKAPRNRWDLIQRKSTHDCETSL
jgi:hypothetical protein